MRQLLAIKPIRINELFVSNWITLPWLFLMSAAILYGYLRYYLIFDIYEHIIFLCSAITLIYGGLKWRPICYISLIVSSLSVLALLLYRHELESGSSHFILRYLLASQAAITWMSILFGASCTLYIAYLFKASTFAARAASTLSWSAVSMGLVGLLVRWHESYLLGIPHIPISNLYEVFILFCLITALLYLYYESRYRAKSIGAFVMPIIIAAVGFLSWYSYSRGAHTIQPLVPALQSYWMKIHVPANFIAYGCFSIAAMLACAQLLHIYLHASPIGVIRRLPDRTLLSELIYKYIALGFAFFTLATILGSLWAAEAWGGYWSWDPKETWALIVWLNYAAWLHMHMIRAWHEQIMAWWTILGLLLTLFAFLGVNLFLSGLHAYGEL